MDKERRNSVKRKLSLAIGMIAFLGSMGQPLILLAATTTKKNAASIVNDGRSGVAVIGKALKTAKADSKAKSIEPFLKAVKRSNAAFEELDKAVKRKSKDFSKGAAKAYEASKVLEVTFLRSGFKNTDAEKGVKAVVDASNALYENYSAGAVRKMKGGKLSEKEKLQFEKVKAAQKEFAGKLGKLRTQLAADKHVDPVLLKTVDKMQMQSEKILKSGSSVEDFVDALALVAHLSGVFDGWTYYVPATYQNYWVEVVPMVTRWDVVYYETYDIINADTTWEYYEKEVKLPNSYDVVQVSSADLSTYDRYVDSLEVGSYEEVNVDDVGDYDSYDNSITEDSGEYLEDGIEAAVDEEMDNDAAADKGDDDISTSEAEDHDDTAADATATEADDGGDDSHDTAEAEVTGDDEEADAEDD